MSKLRFPLILLLVLLVAAGVGLVVLWPHLEGEPPRITIEPPLTHLGKDTPVKLVVEDRQQGVGRVRVILAQNGQERQLAEEIVPAGTPAGRGLEPAVYNIVIKPRDLGLIEGEATLVVEARDRSYRNWLQGNLARVDLKLVVDLTPPRLADLSGMIYLTHGGTGVAVYQVDDPEAAHGVTVGQLSFTGVAPWQGRDRDRMCYFAYPVELAPGADIRLWARDRAGNQTTAPLDVRFKNKKFRDDTLQLSDRFLEAVEPRFAGMYPPEADTPLKKFVWINEKLRAKNHQAVVAATSELTPYQLWRGVFLRPEGKTTAGFGDHRTYYHQKDKVSQSLHLGIDLAHTARSAVPAAAAGRVTFAGELGIYGNAVAIDHGQGVYTLYGHLSELAVRPGQNVARDEALGRSGTTGLALGDHLHFSVLVGGVFVSPTEWWDPHWIQDNVNLRFKEAGLTPPLAPGAGSAPAAPPAPAGKAN
ncbi:MAG: M23 family metallopeptidase [Deltaproteobacteria bacterium]|nr:M23 family metallopeptidase [Deltaproteobacteria bacterium]